MADPYAARDGVAVGEQPADPGPTHDLVERFEGHCALDLVSLTSAQDAAGRRFIAAVVRDEGPLPPLAAIEPAFAVLLLLRSPNGCRPANDALEALEAAELPIYLLKQGLVAGPAGRAGAYTVKAELIERALGAALAGQVEWELDADFGYRVAARVPGLEGSDADALCPRLLYAAADRVYEHAEAVATLKRERHRRATAVPGLDERIVRAGGWPVEPTGDRWKD